MIEEIFPSDNTQIMEIVKETKNRKNLKNLKDRTIRLMKELQEREKRQTARYRESDRKIVPVIKKTLSRNRTAEVRKILAQIDPAARKNMAEWGYPCGDCDRCKDAKGKRIYVLPFHPVRDQQDFEHFLEHNEDYLDLEEYHFVYYRDHEKECKDAKGDPEYYEDYRVFERLLRRYNFCTLCAFPKKITN